MDFINYLNNPQLVADFQKVFGIESRFDSQSAAAKLSSLSSTKTVNSLPKSPKQRPNKKKQRSISPKNQQSAQQENEKFKTENSNTENESKNKHRRQLSLVNNTDHANIIASTIIHSRFWFYLFHVGAAMGYEIFYCLFFPFWFWNVDGAIARKVGFLWGIFMYIGQATKDLLCMPRPASPPVVKLEERYVAEYGFPSTHAMVSTGLPISLVVLSYARYNIDLTVSLTAATIFCCWVCSSRLYLGMVKFFFNLF
jgi:sphingosine-1-phosphate phosphatase 1